MQFLFSILLAIGCFVASWGLTGAFRRYALAHFLIDVPNSRSSHNTATPRGGGIAIALSTIVALLTLGWTNQMDWQTVSGLCVGGTLAALIGFVDDWASLAPQWRLIGHFAAASWALAEIGGLPPLSVMGHVMSGWVGFATAAFYLVWMLNLTNFMDGIDGLAGVEAISACLGGILVIVAAAPNSDLWVPGLIVAAATLGFLVWNWPPAKVFMGDAGSGFLGLTLGVLSLQAGWVVTRLFWSWIILLGVFVVDATVTLIRRITTGKKFYEAHRSHAYQHAAARRGAHMPVTLAVGVINLCWLLPVALMVAVGWVDGFTGVLITYVPLAVAAVLLGAGRHPRLDASSPARGSA